MTRECGVTLVEMLTILVALVVVAAVALPLWHTHELRARRSGAMKALLEIQAAQDRHFGQHARYADAAQLHLPKTPADYTLEVKRNGDALGYVASAVAVKAADVAPDTRCARLSIDQHGRRFALDDSGKDSTADCWRRK